MDVKPFQHTLYCCALFRLYTFSILCSKWNKNSLHSYAVNKSRPFTYLTASVLVVLGSSVLCIYLFYSLSTYTSFGASLDANIPSFLKITSLFNVNAKIFLICILFLQMLIGVAFGDRRWFVTLTLELCELLKWGLLSCFMVKNFKYRKRYRRC